MDSKAMVIEEMDRLLALIRSQRFKKGLLFDNAAPHREQVTTDKLAQLGYVLTHRIRRTSLLPPLLGPTELPGRKGHKKPSSP
ncbi:unnamed protein product [Heligmosomoides polygyrus]|uniref:DDE_3 domain-containing protein n=1 Tax=Heligmosomoides polygyrus TaxID=6339 RepID=A0A183GSU5_HELPZ|nr:unnamed protein product [Heligmosomoides polygyrus]